MRNCLLASALIALTRTGCHCMGAGAATAKPRQNRANGCVNCLPTPSCANRSNWCKRFWRNGKPRVHLRTMRWSGNAQVALNAEIFSMGALTMRGGLRAERGARNGQRPAYEAHCRIGARRTGGGALRRAWN